MPGWAPICQQSPPRRSHLLRVHALRAYRSGEDPTYQWRLGVNLQSTIAHPVESSNGIRSPMNVGMRDELTRRPDRVFAGAGGKTSAGIDVGLRVLGYSRTEDEKGPRSCRRAGTSTQYRNQKCCSGTQCSSFSMYSLTLFMLPPLLFSSYERHFSHFFPRSK